MTSIPQDGEDRIARELEIVHEQMIAGSTDVSDLSEDEALASAAEVLDLIERVREIESDAAIDTPFDYSTRGAATGQSPDVADDKTTLATKHIGRFEIKRQLGQGGYGLVFLAHDPKLNRDVALKVPRPEALVTQELRLRFMYEARAAAGLDHPNIVPVFDAGQAGPIYYIASRFVDGIPLSKWLSQRNHQVGIETAARITATLAGALGHAHERGVIHRDLKPANVLLQVDHTSNIPEDQIARSATIADFGLAKLADDQASNTRTGAIVGTPAYMSPEQTKGDKTAVGPGADIYGLGAILYELLTGEPPFRRDSIVETIKAIQDDEPVAPRKRNRLVARDLQAICQKCLEKDPSARYLAAQELQDDLRRFLDGQPVLARPVTTLNRIGKFTRRKPLIASLLAVVCVSLVATTAGWLSAAKALRRESVALGDAQRAEADAQRRYLQTKHAIDEYFVQVSENQLLTTPGLTPLRHNLLSAALGYYERFADEQTTDTELVGELQEANSRIASIKADLGDKTEALKRLRQSLALLDRQLAEAPDSNELLHRKAIVLRRTGGLEATIGQPQAGLATLDSALALESKLIQQQPRKEEYQDELATINNQRALVLGQLGQPREAAEAARAALEFRESLVNKAPNNLNYQLQLANCRGQLSNILRSIGQVDEALGLAEALTEQLRETVQQDPSALDHQETLAKSLGNLSKFYYLRKEHASGAKVLAEAMEIFERLALIHPQVTQYQVGLAKTNRNMAVFLISMGRLDEAETRLRTALGISQTIFDKQPEHVQLALGLASCHVNLGGLLGNQGDYENAESEVNAAVALYHQVLDQAPENVPVRVSLGSCYQSLGSACNQLEQWERAIGYLDASVAVFRKLLDEYPENPSGRSGIFDAIETRAEVLTRLSRFDEAFQDWQSALEFSASGKETGLHLKMAVTHARAGDHQQALSILDEYQKAARNTAAEVFLLARGLAIVGDAIAEQRVRAVAALQSANELGYFDNAKHVEVLKSSHDFDNLRSRSDFQQLMASLDSES